MTFATPGTPTSDVEVTNISPHGIWLLLRGQEKLLPYEHFPWFQQATVEQISDVELQSAGHLYWPKLDIDLAVESIDHPERFPLISKVAQQIAGGDAGQSPGG